MSIATALQLIYPDIVFPDDCLIIDKGDSLGPRIVNWNYKHGPQPNDADIAALSDKADALSKFQKLQTVSADKLELL